MTKRVVAVGEAVKAENQRSLTLLDTCELQVTMRQCDLTGHYSSRYLSLSATYHSADGTEDEINLRFDTSPRLLCSTEYGSMILSTSINKKKKRK